MELYCSIGAASRGNIDNTAASSVGVANIIGSSSITVFAISLIRVRLFLRDEDYLHTVVLFF